MVEKIFDLTIENLNQFASDFLIPKKLTKEDLKTFILKVNSSKPLMITLKANFEPSVLGLNFDKEKELFTVDHNAQKKIS